MALMPLALRPTEVETRVRSSVGTVLCMAKQGRRQNMRRARAPWCAAAVRIVPVACSQQRRLQERGAVPQPCLATWRSSVDTLVVKMGENPGREIGLPFFEDFPLLGKSWSHPGQIGVGFCLFGGGESQDGEFPGEGEALASFPHSP